MYQIKKLRVRLITTDINANKNIFRIVLHEQSTANHIMFFSEDLKPICDVYTQPGRWYYLKYIVFVLFLYIKKLTSSIFQTNNLCDEKEKSQPLSDHFNAFDAVFFSASNYDGFYMAAGIERRPMGISNGLFYLVIPGKGVLCSNKVPDTLLFGTNRNHFDVEGIKFTPVVPMEQWNVSFEGKMRFEDNPDVTVDVKFEGSWKAKSNCFNYDTDLDIHTIARSIARETWGKKLFKNLSSAHQSHYEQIGKMTANIIVDGEEYKTSMDSFRDHSYGDQRDWKLMHRYAFHHIFCKSGMSIVVGVISQPCTASLFEVGYVCLPDSKECIPIQSCDFKLYQHGENGTLPQDYAFTIEAGGIQYVIRVNVIYESEHFKGFNWDARLRERFVKYLVDQDIGWGVSEFHYNNKSGRPEKYTETDPEWYKTLHRERIAS